MHPAPSIIVFTTLSGLGYGLAAVLGLGLLDAAALSTRIAHVLALIMIGGGLLASTLHLGNPQRAWRAFSQWRSSWLSREGVVAVATFVPLLWSAWLGVIEGRYAPLPGLLGAVGCAMTVYCTSMIYASLRSIDAWHTWLTPVCYLLFALAGGVLLASLAGLSTGPLPTSLQLATAAAIVAAWAFKVAWWMRLRSFVPASTPETATGLGHIGKVRLFERPHVNDNYLNREMGYVIARKHAEKLSRLAMIVGGVLPLGLLLIAFPTFGGPGSFVLTFLALLCFAAGIVVERWLFFAEARHAVANYY